MRLFALILAAGVLDATTAAAQESDEQQIRRNRAYSNASIARHDTLGIGAAMASDIVVITSRSAKTNGRSPYLVTFEDQFRARPDVVYVRTPEQVRVFVPWGMASNWDAGPGRGPTAMGASRSVGRISRSGARSTRGG